MRLLLAFAFCSVGLAGTALADDTHYQNQLLGERALGMGGAFTAVSTDPTASFYNPGGLAMSLPSNVSASLNVYGAEHRVVEGGFVSLIGGELRSVDLENTSFPTIPTTFGVLRTFGESLEDGSRRHAVAFSMLIPDQSSLSYDASIGESGVTDVDVFRFSETDRTLWVGPSYAIRVSDDLSVGLSAFLEMRSFSRSYSRSMETPGEPLPGGSPTSEVFSSERYDTQIETFEMLLRLGALYRPFRGLRVGMALGLPSIHVWGDGSISNQIAIARFDLDDPYGYYVLKGASGLDARSFTPLELRLGLAVQPSADITVSFDVSYHLPTYDLPDAIGGGSISAFGEYDRISSPGDGMSRPAFDEAFVRTVERRGVANLNAGFEWIIADAWPVRAGVFTNFSSAPPVSTQRASLDRIDVVGGTLSVGHRFDGFTINFGVLGSAGWGSSQALNLTGEPTPYLERDVRSELFYFFLSGAQQIVVDTVEGWIEG